jgi:serine/threonine protein kinase
MQTKRRLYIVMECAEGGELFHLIQQQRRLSDEQARGYFQQLISGLWYCHSHHIAHRDLKPENLLLTADHRILKISDFGLCSLHEHDGSLTHEEVGTPMYQAPEITTQQRYNPFIADMWSCGVILYAMLHGYLPTDSDEPKVFYREIEAGTYHISSSVSAEAKSLIQGLLVVNPDRRLTIHRVVGHPWVTHGVDVESDILRSHLTIAPLPAEDSACERFADVKSWATDRSSSQSQSET